MAFYQWNVFHTTYMIGIRGSLGWTRHPLPAIAEGYQLFFGIGGIGGFPTQFRGIIDTSDFDPPFQPTPHVPPRGDQSLLFERNPQGINAPVTGFASPESCNLTPKTTHFIGTAPFDLTPFSKGLTEGAIRGAWCVNYGPSIKTYNSWGFCFMQSQEDLTTGTPNFYMARMRGSGAVAGPFEAIMNIEIVKYTGATLHSGAEVVISPVTPNTFNIFTPTIIGPTIVDEQPFTMMATFSANPTIYGGAVYIEVYCGYALDYSDLTLVTTAIDFSTPHTTSVAEGPAVDSGPGTAFQINHDNTEVLTISGYTPLP